MSKRWEKLRHKYKIKVVDETSYEEVFNYRLSQLSIVMTLSMLVVLAIAGGCLLVAFTGLREFIPGYPNKDERAMLLDNLNKIHELEDAISTRDKYLKSLLTVFTDSVADMKQDSLNNITKMGYDTIKFTLDEDELLFREEMEERERFNLRLTKEEELKEYMHFFLPVNGLVTQTFDERTSHYGIDVVANEDAKVSSVLDGVVVFADWTVNTGYVIQIQHNNDLISIYKHNSVLYKKQGDKVSAGEVIATVGNTGEITTGPHLHFELWRKGIPLNPEEFIKFD